MIKQADAILITTGAGMGIDSGLPDFRGQRGLWRAFPPLEYLGLIFEEIASPDSFDENPRLAWGFYGLRLNNYRQAQPHQGFQLLKKWAADKPHGYYVWTSNVDGHFAKAGFDTERLIEKHGSIHKLQRVRGCKDDVWSNEDFIPEIDIERCLLVSDIPTCPHCGDLARPNILMFDDPFWLENDLAEKAQQFQNSWLRKPQSLVVIEIGAGKTLLIIRSFSERIAKQKIAPLIRINPDEPQVPQMHHVGLAMGGLEALQVIDVVL